MNHIHYAKSIVLVIYWGIRTIKLMKLTGTGIIILSGQILTNAILLKSWALIFISGVFALLGSLMILKFR